VVGIFPVKSFKILKPLNDFSLKGRVSTEVQVTPFQKVNARITRIPTQQNRKTRISSGSEKVV